MMKNLIIIGAGAVGGFIAYNHEHLQDRYRLIGFLDDDKNKVGQTVFGYEVLGTTEEVKRYKDCAFLLGIAIPKVKQKIVSELEYLQLDYINYISPMAWISSGVKLGKGVIIYPHTSIEHEVVVGDFATINLNCSIGHNTFLEDYITLAPGVGLAGYTQCLEASEMGIGAKTRQNVVIGKNSIVGGQAMVTQNIEDNSLAVGVPAKVIKQL